MQKARIKLSSENYQKLEDICDNIKSIADDTGIAVVGPVPLPTKRLLIPTRKTPCGDGSETYEKWEMRIHKRLLDVQADPRALRQIMRLQVPDDIHIEIELKS